MPGVRPRRGMAEPGGMLGGEARRGRCQDDRSRENRSRGDRCREDRKACGQAWSGPERRPRGLRATWKCPVGESLEGSADGAGDETEVNVPAAYEQRLRRGHGHIVECSTGPRQYFPTELIGNIRHSAALPPGRLSSQDDTVRNAVALLPGESLRASIPINPMGKMGIRRCAGPRGSRATRQAAGRHLQRRSGVADMTTAVPHGTAARPAPAPQPRGAARDCR